jgi:glycyl-tRNA synthetase beta chain
VEQGDFQGVLQQLAGFRRQVDRFFDQVMIMDEDPVVRSNRLAMLKQALKLYRLCGDLRLVVSNK